MITKWLYCFACGASHLFTQLENGDWRCPNCHSIRGRVEIEAVETSWKRQDEEAKNETPE